MLYSDRAIELVNDSLVIDMLSLFDLGRLFDQESDPFAYSREELKALRNSGIDVFHPAIGLNERFDAMTYMAGCNGIVAEHPDLVMRIDSTADLNAVRDNGKVGIILGVQDSEHFESVEDVRLFYNLGQRVSQLTYNSWNSIGTGSTSWFNFGISGYGESIVAAMNEVRMAVDVSHCGDQTTLDAFELSREPVLITHSNCRALAPGHPRCKTDEAIKAMAATGGVMGVTGVRNFVRNDEPTTIEHYVDHIDHIAGLVGIEHAGIGTDSDLKGYDALPPDVLQALKAAYSSAYGFRERIDIEGLDHPKKMYDITEALIRRGYTNSDIRGVLGENFRRALGEIWDA
jgi:membrane dipeptidase